MDEKKSIKTYKRLFIVVSIILVGVLCLQGIYWVKQREQTANAVNMEQTADTANTEQTADTMNTGQEALPAESRCALSREGYTLQQVVVMSRHNIRAPLSGKGSVLDTLTPHEWFAWSSDPSDLSLRGGNAETSMGQYFRKWLEKESLFPKNYQPEGDEVRIYANSKQRTIATARFFTAGLFPAADVNVEYHMAFDQMDPVFEPKLHFLTDEYGKDVLEQVEKLYHEKVLAMEDNYALIEDVIDVKESEAYKSGEFTGFKVDDLGMELVEDKEPKPIGSLRTATSVADALVLQYLEESDPVKAAFGHKLSFDEWQQISEVKDLYNDVTFCSPLVAHNVVHPLLQEIRGELTKDGRKFTFLCGHDSDVGPVLTCLKAEGCELAGAVETKTPIGGKIVFCRWLSADGQDYMSVDLVYESSEQLQNLSVLGTDNPPYAVPQVLEGLEQNSDGLYKTEAVLERFDEAIGEYDKMLEKYGLQNTAVPEDPSEIEEEALDEAA